ncbi:hypothetical protein H6P81_015744 [Aristolochia fimbriata]|uniref:Uncharacterized protein n=1 Tax=Aristolochia fimbriata TaxID=158543 RepID=A0AAV7E730_ARIFI|nr:hypothetical protein H6P81_015744 [Aristolochia fimbriata]
MAEDLDDGELYLPSDIFPDETFYSRRPVPETNGFAHVEELAQHLAALAMLDSPAPNPRPPAGSFELRKSVRVGALYPPAQTGLGFQALQNVGNGQGHACRGGTHFPPLLGPMYHYHHSSLPGKVVQAPAEIIQRERARVFQRQPNPMQNRAMPVRVGGSGTREYGGTGVFLPRVINAESRRKPSPGAKNTEPRQQPMRNEGLGRQGKPYPHSSEKGLPRDWTY